MSLDPYASRNNAIEALNADTSSFHGRNGVRACAYALLGIFGMLEKIHKSIEHQTTEMKWSRR